MNLALFGGFDRRPLGRDCVRGGNGPSIRLNAGDVFGGVTAREPEPGAA